MCRMINNTTNATLNAVLRIKPEAEILTSDAMRTIIEDARRSGRTATAQVVIFDFSNVKQIGPQWTVVWAMIIDFARSLNATCRVESLTGQPAATAALFRRSRELTNMIDAATLRPAA